MGFSCIPICGSNLEMEASWHYSKEKKKQQTIILHRPRMSRAKKEKEKEFLIIRGHAQDNPQKIVITYIMYRKVWQCQSNTWNSNVILCPQIQWESQTLDMPTISSIIQRRKWCFWKKPKKSLFATKLLKRPADLSQREHKSVIHDCWH